MNETGTSPAIGNIDDLEKKSRAAAEELNRANRHNAVWEKAAKALKPGLADLSKTRDEAKKESKQADKLLKSLEDNYDSDASDGVRKAREAVDKEIEASLEKMSKEERDLNKAKEAAAAAKKSLEESTANFDKGQKDLLGLSKAIQDQQKQIVALEAEVKDADAKHLLVEAVVKLEDLKSKLGAFNEMVKAEYEAKLWQNLNSAADDLLQKTDSLAEAEAKVAPAEASYKTAKTEYENAVKNRIETIKPLVADEQNPAKEAPSKPSYDASPSMG